MQENTFVASLLIVERVSLSKIKVKRAKVSYNGLPLLRVLSFDVQRFSHQSAHLHFPLFISANQSRFTYSTRFSFFTFPSILRSLLSLSLSFCIFIIPNNYSTAHSSVLCLPRFLSLLQYFLPSLPLHLTLFALVFLTSFSLSSVLNSASVVIWT